MPSKESMIILKARKNDLKWFQVMFREGVIQDYLEAKNQLGRTALSNACLFGHLDLSKFLIDKGADVNTQDNEGWSPLHKICFQSRALLKDLINDKELSPEDREGYENYIMDLIGKYYSIVELLLKQNSIKVNIVNNEGHTPLLVAIKNNIPEFGNNLKIVELLLNNRNTDIDIQDKEGYTPLHKAVIDNNPELVNLLLKSERITADAVDNKEYSPLFYSLATRNLDIIKSLVEKNADPFAANNFGATPWQAAIESKNIDILCCFESKFEKLLSKSLCDSNLTYESFINQIVKDDKLFKLINIAALESDDTETNTGVMGES